MHDDGLKIVVYTITKNEEKFIRRYCDSAKEADDVVFVDTGSTDSTVQVAKECGATVHQISVSPWRFDVARNASLALLPADADVCIALDADEVLMEGWRQEVAALWKDGVTRIRYLFDWGSNVKFMSDKFHSRAGYLWKHPCHERLVPDPRLTEKYAVTQKLLVTHMPDPHKSRGQYLDLLAVGAKEDPHDSRNSFYYARELTFYSHWEKAIVELKRYLSLPTSKWGAERGYAARLIGKSLTSLGRQKEAEEWYMTATREAPERRESWVELADYYHKTSQWSKCLEAARVAIGVEGHRNDWPNDPVAWGPKPYDLLALAAYYTGDKSRAIKYGQIALEMKPDDARLLRNMQWYLGNVK